MIKPSGRFLLLALVLIAAFIYRFPVEIQKFARDAKSYVTQAVRAVESLLSGEEKSSIQESQPAEKEPEIVIIRLKNKRKIEGTIIEEREKEIIVDIGFGTVGVSRADIEKIASPTGAEKEKILRERGIQGEKTGGRVTEIRYRDPQRIIVNVLLNGKVRTNLILDTGAPYVVLTPKIAQKIFGGKEPVSKKLEMQWTDGTSTPGKLVLLESVKAGSVEVKNVKAVISDSPVIDAWTDGLLGMSFLNYFHIKIDSKSNKVTLEKR